MDSANEAAGTRGSSFEWSREAWRWHPGLGRWSQSIHGRPKATVYGRLDPMELRPHERYDYWRTYALYDIEADSLARDDGAFQAWGAGLVGPTGSLLRADSSSTSGHRRAKHTDRDGIDDITIGIVLSGERRHGEGEERTLARVGEFFAYDARRDSQVSWSPFSDVHLALRRQTVEAALGGEVPSSGRLAELLTASQIAPFLASQMQMLSQRMARLGDAERAGLLQVTIDIANLALESIAGRAAEATPELFTAALRLIETHFANPDLDPSFLARKLGCSRATLYRCFSDRGLGIAATIREIRLTQARLRLESAPPHLTIAEVASRCGYHDPAFFSRIFKAYFGITPQDARAASQRPKHR